MTPLWQLGWTAGAFATATLIALALRRLILTGLPRWAPTSEVLSAGAKAFRGPSLWWCLAVALALQDTLSNLFAGIHLLADSPLRVGDHVRLGDRVEGFVIDVGWRSTRIRSLSNDVVVVPNQVVAKEPITNYDLPEPRSAFRLKISVDDSADPDTVIKVLRDEIERAAGQVPGLSANPAPWVSLLSGVTEGSLDVTVSYYVPTPSDQYRVLHELRKRCSERLHREGIAVRGAAKAA